MNRYDNIVSHVGQRCRSNDILKVSKKSFKPKLGSQPNSCGGQLSDVKRYNQRIDRGKTITLNAYKRCLGILAVPDEIILSY